jgi:oxygen-dependent protoporphyrinogen oxidase
MSAGNRVDVVVVGAGISGLSAAWWLSRAGLSVEVVEASNRVGGAITTARDGDWLFEIGPNTVLEGNPSVVELIRSASLDDERIEATPAGKKRYLWKGDRLVPLPGGPGGFLSTPLFSVGAKLRLMREPWIPRGTAGDESIADFVRRRLGSEMLDYAVGPFVSGVYAGDPERLSVRWATSKIFALEQEYGSLIRGALAKRKIQAAATGPSGRMISFRNGLETLPKRLAEGIGRVRTGTPATRILRGDGGPVVELAGGERIHPRRAVVAVGPDAAAPLLDEATSGASRPFAEIPWAGIAVVSLGFRREAIAHPLGGFGFLAPRRESLRILGCLFPSEFFAGRAPANHVALSAFAGGRTDPEAASLPDAELLRMVLGDLRRALGIAADPVRYEITRWPKAIPQYEVGHGRHVDLARRIEAGFPGLHLAGNFLRGVSVPLCIETGAQTAREILTHWGDPGPLPAVGSPAPGRPENRPA